MQLVRTDILPMNPIFLSIKICAKTIRIESYVDWSTPDEFIRTFFFSIEVYATPKFIIRVLILFIKFSDASMREVAPLHRLPVVYFTIVAKST